MAWRLPTPSHDLARAARRFCTHVANTSDDTTSTGITDGRSESWTGRDVHARKQNGVLAAD